MIETSNPEINVDELMNKTREEVDRRRERPQNFPRSFEDEATEVTSCYPEGAISPLKLSSLDLEAPFEAKANGEYHVNDLLKYHHKEFVKKAYLAILRRSSDFSGLDHYIGLLGKGDVSKIEILGRLRYSPEGKRVGTKIRGLLLPFAAHMTYKVPLFGYLMRLGTAVFRLPKIMRNITLFENHAFSEYESIKSHQNQIANQVESSFNQLNEAVVSETQKLIELRLSLKGGLAECDNRISGLEESVNQGLAERDGRIAGLEESVKLGFSERDCRILGLEESVNHGFSERDSRIVGLEESVNQGLTERDSRIVGLEESVNQGLAERDNRILELQKTISYLKTSLVLQERRLSMLLEEARKRLPEPFDQEQLQAFTSEETHLLDPLYLSFEDQFRGTREDIKDRLKVYVPLVRKAKAGTDKRPILDVGCGRGEWLELLEEEGLTARGLDINRILIEQCRERGLDVTEGEAIGYLRNLPDASLEAVTAFHLIEHLPFKVLMQFLGETVRVLKSGGLAVFETPNPENILVGACNFYYDPTHRNPLPPAMIKFLVESRGLCQVKIKRLHPYGSAIRIPDDGSKLVGRFNEYFYAPQDYAVIGYKV